MVSQRFCGPIQFFCGIPGKARTFNSEFFVPFVRSVLIPGGWNRFYDER